MVCYWAWSGMVYDCFTHVESIGSIEACELWSCYVDFLLANGAPLSQLRDVQAASMSMCGGRTGWTLDPYGSKHCLRRYLTLQIIPQTLPKKVLGSIGDVNLKESRFRTHRFFQWFCWFQGKFTEFLVSNWPLEPSKGDKKHPGEINID